LNHSYPLLKSRLPRVNGHRLQLGSRSDTTDKVTEGNICSPLFQGRVLYP
jgi:hypothetical protein